jgi:hypothetical protein
MSRSSHRCALCAETDDLRAVVVAGQPLHLCTRHAARLGQLSPASYDDLSTFLAELSDDRRHVEDRRVEDRRFFPRAESRRHNTGRRVNDAD